VSHLSDILVSNQTGDCRNDGLPVLKQDESRNMEKVKVRPHHILCLRFLKLEFPERGERYKIAEQGMRDLLQKEDNVLLEVAEGIDELCRSCTNLRDDQCRSPQGSEESVRKWDHILLKGLRISYGDTRSAKQWIALIERKAPLDFCRTRCPKKNFCTVFSIGSKTP
jgi:hypothetical protein